MTGMTVDGLRWEVRVRGAGPPLLLVHGFMGRGAAWEPHARSFARDHRVVLVDLPGHGRSATPADPARGSIERMADDIATILERTGSAPAAVLGYSLGARLALRLAIAHGRAVRRLVLESPSAGLASEADRRSRRDADEERARCLERDGVDAFVEAWEREPVFASFAALPAAPAARVRADRRRNRAAGLAASLRGAGQGSMEPLHDRLARVAIPTLVIAGEKDPVGRARADDVAAGIPGARLELVATAGHAPHIENPVTFRSLVRAFLKEDHAA